MEHHHRSTLVRTFLCCLLLSTVLGFELVGLTYSGSLLLLAHLFEIGSDLASYISLLVAAIWSLVKENNGQDNEREHTEEVWAGRINLAIMGFGVIFALTKVLSNLENPQPVTSGWALVGPCLAVLVYLAISWLLSNPDQGLGIAVVRGHNLGDLTSSTLVLVASIVVWGTGNAWTNPVCALLIVGLLSFILAVQYRNFQKGKNLPI